METGCYVSSQVASQGRLWPSSRGANAGKAIRRRPALSLRAVTAGRGRELSPCAVAILFTAALLSLVAAVAIARAAPPGPTRTLRSGTGNLEGSSLFPARWYPGVADSSQAASVSVLPGDASPILSIPMDASGGTVQGQVFGPGTQPVPVDGALVEALLGSVRVLSRSGADGRFTLNGVPAGPVIIRFATNDPLSHAGRVQALYYPGVAVRAQATPVTVTDGGTTILDPITLPASGVLGGQVRAGDTGLPIAGTRVWIQPASVPEGARKAGAPQSPDSTNIWSVRASASGSFVFGGIIPGDYLLEAVPGDSAYIPEFYGGALAPGQAQSIHVDADSERTDLDLPLDRGGVISGTVKHDDLSPFPGLLVTATNPSTGQVYRSTTDDGGNYAIVGLPSGSYRIFVPAIGKYYIDSDQPNRARLVPVTQPEEVPYTNLQGELEINCELPPETQGTLAVSVQGDFAGLAGGVIIARSGQDTAEVEVTDPGIYNITCLPSGKYTLEAALDGPISLLYYPHTTVARRARLISIPVGDTVAVAFRLEKSVRLSGRVYSRATNAALAGVHVRAVELDSSRVEADGVTAADGSFLLDRVFVGALGLNSTASFARAGLPPGRWQVMAETTGVADPIFTPVMQPALQAIPETDGGVALEWWVMPEARWHCVLARFSAGGAVPGSDGQRVETVETAENAPPAERRFIDRPPNAGPFVYQLSATPEDGAGVGGPLVAWSDTVRARASGTLTSGAVRVAPVPWDQRQPIRFQLSAPLASGGRLQLFTAAGRRITSLDWPAGSLEVDWSGGGSSISGSIPAGVYFFLLESRRPSGGWTGREHGAFVVQRR